MLPSRARPLPLRPTPRPHRVVRRRAHRPRPRARRQPGPRRARRRRDRARVGAAGAARARGRSRRAASTRSSATGWAARPAARSRAASPSRPSSARCARAGCSGAPSRRLARARRSRESRSRSSRASRRRRRASSAPRATSRIYARMGTTATLAAIAHGALLCAQIGDSRAYVLRARAARRSHARTRRWRAACAGPAPSRPSRSRAIVGPNVILQALGSSTRLEVAVTRTPLAQGDVVLVCSDGLYGVRRRCGDRRRAAGVDAISARACERSSRAPTRTAAPTTSRAPRSTCRRDALPTPTSLPALPRRSPRRHGPLTADAQPTTCVSIATVSSNATRSCGDCARNCSIFGMRAIASSSSLSRALRVRAEHDEIALRLVVRDERAEACARRRDARARRRRP